MFKQIIGKIQSKLMSREDRGGSEIVQVVIVLGFALGLGLALILLQNTIGDTLNTTGNNLNTFFGDITKNMHG